MNLPAAKGGRGGRGARAGVADVALAIVPVLSQGGRRQEWRPRPVNLCSGGRDTSGGRAASNGISPLTPPGALLQRPRVTSRTKRKHDHSRGKVLTPRDP